MPHRGRGRHLLAFAVALASVSAIAPGSFAAAQPDLVVSALTNPPTKRMVGTTFSITDTTKNAGTAKAGSSTTRYFLSKDSTKSSGDVLLGSRWVSGLAAGATSRTTKNVAIPKVTTGTYRVLACADSLKKVTESREGNNCRASGSSMKVVNPYLFITEFSAGPEPFIEIYNGGNVPIRIDGLKVSYTGSTQTIKPHPLQGTGPVTIDPQDFAFGIPNPVDPESEVVSGFVLGAPGTTWAPDPSGDDLRLLSGSVVLDRVNYSNTSYGTEEQVELGQFPVSDVASTQLDMENQSFSPRANDNGNNWCLTFRSSRTRGSTNQRCEVMINEVLYDSSLPGTDSDDGRTFVELTGSAGASIAGFTLRGVEGEGPDTGAVETTVSLAASGHERLPLDGMLLVADELDAQPGTSLVPSPDLITPLGLEDGPDSVQLIGTIEGGPGTVDVLGYGYLTQPLDDTGQKMYVDAAATDASAPGVPLSLARSAGSRKTDSNAAAFYLDPTATPGQANDANEPSLIDIAPDNGPVSASTPFQLRGTNLVPSITWQTWSSAAISTASPELSVAGKHATGCSVTDNDNDGRGVVTLSCTAPPADQAGRGGVVYSPPFPLGGLAFTALLPNGWTYTGSLNETDTTEEADYCEVVFPDATATTPNVPVNFFGQIFESGLTDTSVTPASGISAQVGIGPAGTDPRTTSEDWTYFDATANSAYNFGLNNDEFVGSVSSGTPGVYSVVYRFTFDDGINYTYCDLDGAGSNAGATFDQATLATLTVAS